MSDKPITDEGIEQIVQLVAAAEQLGQLMSVTTPEALRFMLKGNQLMQRMANGDASPLDLLSAFALGPRKPS